MLVFFLASTLFTFLLSSVELTIVFPRPHKPTVQKLKDFYLNLFPFFSSATESDKGTHTAQAACLACTQ